MVCESAALRDGPDSRSIRAFANLKVPCEEHLKCRYQIEVIDLRENQQLSRGDQIVSNSDPGKKASATCPKDIGDLFKTVRALVGLDLRKAD